MKNIYFIVLSIIVIFYIIYSVRKDKLNVKTSFGWFLACILMLFLAVFPYSLDWLAHLIGISYPPALFLTLCVVFLIIIDFNYSKKIADMQRRITDLAQELSIVKAENTHERKQ